jgi:hypothetical protein
MGSRESLERTRIPPALARRAGLEELICVYSKASSLCVARTGPSFRGLGPGEARPDLVQAADSTEFEPAGPPRADRSSTARPRSAARVSSALLPTPSLARMRLT